MKSERSEIGRKKRPESSLVVVHTATKALLIKRADHVNFWQSITGTLEWGEQAYDAAIRELKEETGIVVDSLRTTGITRNYAILDEWRHRYPVSVARNREHLFYCYLEQEPQIILDSNEHSAYQWLPFESAIETVWSWSNKIAFMPLLDSYKREHKGLR